ncbi:MAG: hypothetical protein ACXVNF_09985 [Neobacillus sp.]
MDAEKNPLNLADDNEAYHTECMRHYEKVRCYAEKTLSASPLYQARVAKDPDYWKTYSPGFWNLPGVESPSRKK